MEYKPSLPPQNDNIANEHPLKELFVVLSAVLALAFVAFWCLALVVDTVVDGISPQTEAALYKAMAYEGPAAPKELLGKEVQVQALVDSMQQCAGMLVKAKVHLLSSEQANALVVPGGHIFVYSGLLEQVRSSNGLAFVLAHELAHLKQRDHLRAMGRSLVLFSISALLTGDSSGVTELLAPASELGELKYSREREASADDTALQILHCRYGHAGGATELFESLKGKDKDSFVVSRYLSSHPAMQERIDRIERAIKDGRIKSLPVAPLPN